MPRKKDIKSIEEPSRLQNISFYSKSTICGCLLISFTLIIILVYYVDTLNWHAAALGRIFMALLLPYWNWQTLYNARCLIDSNIDAVAYKSVRLDCAVCDGYSHEGLDRIQNVSFNKLRDNYLIRGLPVIIADSHAATWQQNDVETFTRSLLASDTLIGTEPCNVRTNLVMQKWATLSNMITAVQDHLGFMQFRLSEFEAVKAVRRLHPQPYFYAAHLEPAHTVWMLMSNRFSSTVEYKLNVLDLVIVKQLIGKVDFILEGRDDCLEFCGVHEEVIGPGEALVFPSDLWSVHYRHIERNVSVTVVTETFWKH